jgi:predicted component of type VI protein secretion system
MRTLCLIALAALAGCASQPPAESVAKESVTLASAAQPASAAMPAAASAPVQAAASPAAATTASTTGDYKPPAGYKKRVANGQTIYCAKIVVLGSRFPKEDCRSQGELEDMEMQKEGMRSEMSRRQAICGAAAACGSN